MFSAGIDCGAKTTKVVIFGEGRIMGESVVVTGFDQVKAIRTCLAQALEKAGVTEAQLQAICGTGSGKNAVTKALRTTKELVNDIKAMGKGAHFYFPSATTVVDVGAEEGRAARLDEQGNVLDFSINEKCAAGAGSFIEAMARALETTLLEMGPLALKSDQEIPMNAQCAIFAESEVIGLIHARTEKKDISKAIHDAMASRIVSMIRRIGLDGDLIMMGGVAYNPAFVEAVKQQLGVDRICIPDRPELGMAAGAAVVAADED
jgi:predicted CoA-substrate-specific enzyme activase